MEAKVAYDTYEYESGVLNLDFEWDNYAADFEIEEASALQIWIVTKEAAYDKLETKEPIRSFIILDGDVYDILTSRASRFL